MIPPRLQQRWPRGAANDLHCVAYYGSVEGTKALISLGSINIDQGNPEGVTPLMMASERGHSRVVRAMPKRGADVSIAADGDATALHLSANNGHLAVTVDLTKAGADLEARTFEDATSLHLAAQVGHSDVMAALIEAGADVNSKSGNGCTPFFLAAGQGNLRLNAVRKLLRAKADPLLVVTTASGESALTLVAAALSGGSNVVRELI